MRTGGFWGKIKYQIGVNVKREGLLNSFIGVEDECVLEFVPADKSE